MPRISTDNYDEVASWNGSQDLFVVEQSDGTKVATPAQVKQYVLGDMDEVPTQNSNDTVKSGGVFSAVDDVYSVMGQNGAKNLNSYPYNETSHTDNGIAWTDNGDGTVVANNTATGNSGFVCHSRVLSSVNKLIVPNGTYILSGCPSGGSSTTFNIGATITKNGSAMALGTDNGSGATITINGDDNYTDKAIVQIICNIKSGVAASNLTFKPMLRLASDTDDTYQPYAKTNKQLTDELDTAREQLTNLPTAMATGKAAFPAAAVGAQDIEVQFPAGLFTSAPVVTATMSDTIPFSVGSYMEADLYVYNVTKNSFWLRGTRKNANYTWYAHWIAVQM